ncbi:hypothetical protein FZ103_00300 [Streptomonospora sp. PA3]|uniref:hypothetical protein n=1 Tax=Streptomonospora sp. PA3 TaxID=2607326 RepID=UPI0012DC3CE1|nr:hypothetical protein [Streptomonospora sp. PA3]MUL39634.1 hypothetical protein [Streptomonospora sp. PA3]
MDVEESIRRAEEIHAEKDAAEQAEQQQADERTFDEFWSEVESRRRVEYTTIRGVRVQVPAPGQLTMRLRRILDRARSQQRLTTEPELHAAIGDMYGEGALEAWIERGLMVEQLAVILAWGLAQTQGRPISWERAYEAVQAGKAKVAAAAAGKNPGSIKPSGGTGGRSRGGSRRRGGRRKK